jgi:hypothetical protein
MNRTPFAVAAIAAAFAAPIALAADVPATATRGLFRGASTPVQFDVSPPLRSIPPVAPRTDAVPRAPLDLDTGLEGPLGPQGVDTVVQSQVGAGEIPAPGVSFDGPSNISNVSPPDPVGDVGPNHYVAMSNLSFQIFNKSGTSLYGPALNNTLWAGFGGACQNENSGDPIVVHDQFADRWILTQFTAAGPTYFVCVAISTSPDPTGSYYRYALSTGSNFPDYPKLGVGSNAYFFATREFAGGTTFAGIGVYALNRAQLIAGNPAAQVISFLVPPGGTPYNTGDGLQPADIDGMVMPPPGSPHYYVGSMDLGGPYGAPQDALTLWKFNADFITPANSTFVLANTIPVATFDSIFPCTPTSRACIPQAGTAQKVDILSYRQRIVHRLAYRNYGTHESLVTNQSVEASAGMAGLRWYELRDPNGTPTIYQQGTYAPGTSDGIHRWMGSIAMDASGNMALGYSASSPSMFPSVWYTGRLANDTLGTMPQGEGVIIDGTGSQTSTSARWGDYTSMNVDPADDCTFWYVNQYLPVTSTVGWRLRIGSFKFPSCAASGALVQRTFVASGGNDANPCSLVAPCRSFLTAINRTSFGGEVIVLDSAGYGPVVINKAVSIIAPPGVYAGVSVFSGTGIVVNPALGNVTLRGLTINALGGAIGIDFQSGSALYLDNVTVSGFPTAGLNAFVSAAGTVAVHGSTFRGNGTGAAFGGTGAVGAALEVSVEGSQFDGNGTGVRFAGAGTFGEFRQTTLAGGTTGALVQPTTGGGTNRVDFLDTTITRNSGAGIQSGGVTGTANVSLTGSMVSGNGTGVQAGSGAVVYLTDSTVTRNATGLATSGGTINTGSDNRLQNNTVNGSFGPAVPKQ